MKVQVLEEHGYESALKGMALSYYDHLIPFENWWTQERRNKAEKRLKLLAFKGGGHSKALESIQLWVFIQASRDVWQEFDTYRIGMTKQSSSTMHTLDKRYSRIEDFDESILIKSISVFNYALVKYKDEDSPHYKDISFLKKNLPEGWLQERICCFNYKCLQNMYFQRKDHRLNFWKEFFKQIFGQLEHPELIDENYDGNN